MLETRQKMRKWVRVGFPIDAKNRRSEQTLANTTLLLKHVYHNLQHAVETRLTDLIKMHTLNPR